MARITVPNDEDLVVRALNLSVPQQVNRSGWTGRRKVVGLPGAETWTASVEITDLASELQERPWRLFLFRLKGAANTFRLRVACSQRTGTNPTVRAGAVAGFGLPLQGLPANATVLDAGQFITVPLPSGRERLVMLTANLVSNGVGQGTAIVEPSIPEAPAVDTVVETINPWLLCSSIESRLGLDTDGGVSGVAFEVEEAP